MRGTLYLTSKLLKDGRWQLVRAFSRTGVTKKRFASHETAIGWAHENFNNRSIWMDHEIDGNRGHLMTIERWKEDIDWGCFTDDDGYGDLLNEKYEFLQRASISPSRADTLDSIPEAKYILWYNR